MQTEAEQLWTVILTCLFFSYGEDNASQMNGALA